MLSANKNSLSNGGSQWVSNQSRPIHPNGFHNLQLGQNGESGESGAKAVQKTVQFPPWPIWEAGQHRTLPDINAFFADYPFTTEGVIYFVQDRNCDLSPIKIGRSTELRTRVQNIQSALNRRGIVADLQVLATIPGDEDLESYLHYAFAEFGIPFETFGSSEWFRAEKPLLDLIGECRAPGKRPQFRRVRY